MARKTYGTSITSTYLGEQDQDGWRHHAWSVTLTREDQTVTISYRMGLGHEQTKCGKPKPVSIGRYAVRPYATCGHERCEKAGWRPTPPGLYEVITALKGDVTDGMPFAGWCDNYGYDPDSRKALETYLACQQSEVDARRLFGDDWSRILEDEDYE